MTTGSVITLDGSASSDADGDRLSYTWTLTSKPSGSTASLSGATSARPIFTADVAGGYVASLAVSDGKASSTAATVSITANRTAVARYSFLVYGDSRSGGSGTGQDGCSGNAIHIGLVGQMAAEPDTSFVVNLGDMVSGFSGRATNWASDGDCTKAESRGNFKDVISPLLYRTPAPGLQTFFFPVLGNHDDSWARGYPDADGHGFCDVFEPKKLGLVNHTRQNYFQDATNAGLRVTDDEFYRRVCSKSPSERGVYPEYVYYSFDLQGAHFIVLRVNDDGYDLLRNNACSSTPGSDYVCWQNKHQLDWLRDDLARTRAASPEAHIFVFLHAPLVTSSDDHPANASWKVLLPEFSKHRVTMVFSGHNHVYERSCPVFATDADPAGRCDDAKGTVYLVSGGGGSALSGFRALDPRTVVAKAQHHYLRVDVDGSSVTTTMIGTDAGVLDKVTLP